MLIVSKLKPVAQRLIKHFKKKEVEQSIKYDFTDAKPNGPIFIYGTLGQPVGKDHNTSPYWSSLKPEDRDLIHHDESCYGYCGGCHGCTGYYLHCPYILEDDRPYIEYSEKKYGIKFHYFPPDTNPHMSFASMIEKENAKS